MPWSRSDTLTTTRRVDLEVVYVPIGDVYPNPWNPNRQDAFIYEKEKASITEFGFIVPITVRRWTVRAMAIVQDGWQVIDGEHRWKAAKELGYSEVPIIDLGEIDDGTAKQLTIILNETKGQAQPDLVKNLLNDLLSSKTKEQLLRVLPYTTMQFDSMTASFDWGKVEKPKATEERWVMRSYRMPADAADVLDQAIRKVQNEDSCADWQAIERLAADYLGGD
jgi:hypothetical protein